MQLMRIGPAGAEKPVVRVDETTYVDVSDVVADFDEAFFGRRPRPAARRRWRDAGRQRATSRAFGGERIGAPIARPHQILCIGLNYSDHAAETGQAVPDEPILFTKSPNTLVGPNDDVRIPRGSTKTDWEVELGIVIGRRTQLPRPVERGPRRDRRLRARQRRQRARVPDRARRAVVEGQVGRDVQPGRARGSSPPTRSTTCWRLGMWLDVNGVRRQTGSTSTMVFDPYFIVHYLSQFLVLEPGDLINTGTPPGVGHGLQPAGLAAARRRHGARHRRARAPSARHVVGAALSDARVRHHRPRRVRGAGCRPARSPGPGRSSSTSSGSASAAPTSSSSPARWPTCTTGHAALPDAARPRVVRHGRRRSATASTASGSGRRVTGDTMLGCGHCRRCLTGRQHVCEDRFEIGIRGGWPGRARRAAAGPGLGAARAARRRRRRGRRAGRAGRQRAARRPCGAPSSRGDRVLVLGPGTIGLLVALFARGRGRRGAPARPVADVARLRPLARLRRRLDRATTCPTCRWDAVDRRLQRSRRCRRWRSSWSSPAAASSTSASPETPSLVDTRTLALKDVTAVGRPQRFRPASPAPSSVRRRARSTRARWSPPRSASTTSATCSPGERPTGAGPRTQDPRRSTIRDVRRLT